jgi:hypothetical protein
MLLSDKATGVPYGAWQRWDVFQDINSIVDLAFPDEWLVSTRER